MRAVVRDEQVAARVGRRYALREDAKRLDDVIERAVHVEVILLDIVDQRQQRSVMVE